MRSDTEYVGGEGTGSCTEDELEGVLRIEFETRQFGRGVCEGRGYSSEALAITIDVQRTQLRRGELEGWPFEGYGCLCDVAQL